MMQERFYKALYRIRRVEEEIARVYPTDKIKSPVHLSIGQESIAVGVCETLRPDDIAFGTYRSHAYYLAKGGDMKAMIAELYGKDTGCARGKGGSMHLVDVAHGVMGASAVVGTTIPNAVGYAYAMKYLKKDQIVVSFLGDGATDEGVFSESMNFASLKQLPIIFICENNGYAIHTHISKRQRHPEKLVERVQTYGIKAMRIEECKVEIIYHEVKKAVQSLRTREPGPFFFECMTYRWKEHVGPNDDFNLGYRTKEEAAPWIANDDVARLAKELPIEVRSSIEQDVEDEIREAFEYAESSPFPQAEELYTDVFKQG
jgi:TPP-dependent pyruvate/acetoin dehydrogenase alpha subunit